MHSRRSPAAVGQRTPAPAPPVARAGATRRSIAVVTEDPALAQTLRLATPDRTVMIVATPLALADLLLQEHTAVLVLDGAALGQSAPMVIDRLAEQFPELALIAVGSREDEAGLSAQLSSGRIHRFMHRPASIERARTFVAAALRQQARLDIARPAAATLRTALLRWGAALTALTVVALLASRLLAPTATPPPAAGGTPALLQPLARRTAATPAGAARQGLPLQARSHPAAAPPAPVPITTVADAPIVRPSIVVDPPAAELAPDVLAQPPVAPIVEETPPPRRLVAPPPDYPLAARRDGVEGWVVLNLTVAADGHVADAAVTDAEPRDAFEAAALVAVRQWRYSAGDAPTEVRERLVFKLH